MISPSEVKVCYYGMKKNYLRDHWLCKDYINSCKNYKLQTPALYFPNRFPSGLPLSPPLPLFLSKMDDLPRGILTNKGLNKRDAAIFPRPLSLYLPIHFSIQCYLWKVFHTIFKTSTLCLSFYASLLPYCCPPCDFPKGSAICNGSSVTTTWNPIHCQRLLLLLT